MKGLVPNSKAINQYYLEYYIYLFPTLSVWKVFFMHLQLVAKKYLLFPVGENPSIVKAGKDYRASNERER